MYRINIRINEDRSVGISNHSSGTNGENNVTALCFEVPDEYADFNKYLDIVYKNGEKTQTVADTSGK